MSKLTASAPGKLLLFGDHAVVYGYPCIVTAVDQRMYVTVESTESEFLEVCALDVHTPSYRKKLHELGKNEVPKSVAFVEHVYKRFLEKFPHLRGVVITSRSDFSATYGFGSSSAVTVAMACAVNERYQLKLSPKEIFDLCYEAVLDVQGVGSGFDVAAAIWGGTLYYVKPASVVTPLHIPQLPIVVGYTGVKADTVSLIKKVYEMQQTYPEKVTQIFIQIGNIVNEAKLALETQQWAVVGELMKKNQVYLRELGVATALLDRLIFSTEQAGAFGAKLSGAGGGDCMLALTSPDYHDEVEHAIHDAGGSVIHTKLHAGGMRCEK